jgi:CBS domain containing-hemolysin-like protein
MAALNADDPTRAVLELSRTTGFSRFPVIDETLDDVVGIVHVKYALALPRDKRDEVPVSALMMTEPLRVPETMQLDSLMTELRGRGYQLAIVVDEYGGTAGIATLEDLVEELVGEVSDEHDKTRAGIVTARGVVTFPGVLRPDEVKHRIGLEIPDEGPYETAAGYVMSELGEVPKVGDEVSTPDGTLTVVRMEGRRIDRIAARLKSSTSRHGLRPPVCPARDSHAFATQIALADVIADQQVKFLCRESFGQDARGALHFCNAHASTSQRSRLNRFYGCLQLGVDLGSNE